MHEDEELRVWPDGDQCWKGEALLLAPQLVLQKGEQGCRLLPPGLPAEGRDAMEAGEGCGQPRGEATQESAVIDQEPK